MREEFEKMAAAGKLEPQHIEALVEADRKAGFACIEAGDLGGSKPWIPFSPDSRSIFRTSPATRWIWRLPRNRSSRFPKITFSRAKLGSRSVAPDGGDESSGTGQARPEQLWREGYVDQIQQVLVPDVIRDDWKKWWEAAKRELKKDGHFQVPLKENRTDRLSGEGSFAAGSPARRFRAAKGLRRELLSPANC